MIQIQIWGHKCNTETAQSENPMTEEFSTKDKQVLYIAFESVLGRAMTRYRGK